MPLRVGIVDFLNSLPLAWGLRPGAAPPGVEPQTAPPNRLAEQLAAGDIDVGLVPVVAAAALPGARILPGLGIAARREVRSVLLVSRGPIAAVRRLALDERSRTSAALVRILARERWGVEPDYHTARPDVDLMLAQADAALLIGDPALRISREGLQTWDLAAEWRALTGLPFVFAVWTVRPGLDLTAEQESWFAASLEAGEAEFPDVLDTAVARSGLPRTLLERYYRFHLQFRVGAEEERGLSAFLGRVGIPGC